MNKRYKKCKKETLVRLGRQNHLKIRGHSIKNNKNSYSL